MRKFLFSFALTPVLFAGLFSPLDLVKNLFNKNQNTNDAAYTIELKSRSFIPEAGFKEYFKAHPKGTRRFAYLQFHKDAVTPAERETLAQAYGVKFHYSLNPLTWIVEFPSSLSGKEKFFEKARWVSAIPATDKLTPEFKAELEKDPTVKKDINVTFFEGVTSEEAKTILQNFGEIISQEVTEPLPVTFRMKLNQEEAVKLLQQEMVMWMERDLQITSDNVNAAALSDVGDARVNYDVHGDGVTVGVFEVNERRGLRCNGSARPYESHSDFGGRVTSGSDISSLTNFSGHATHVIGTIAGDGSDGGSGNDSARGMAYEALIVAHDTNNAASEMRTSSYEVSNNSWGYRVGDVNWWSLDWCMLWGSSAPSSVFGDYTEETMSLDVASRNWTNTIVIAAGNDRADNDSIGTEDCWNGGTFSYEGDCLNPAAVSKNTIVVGAVDDEGNNSTYFSSWGPTDDGRIKPDVVANGEELFSTYPYSSSGSTGNFYRSMSGTSMSTPVVSGIAALIVERYNDVFGTNPASSMVKALLINGAEDITNDDSGGGAVLEGPDYQHGFGLVNAEESLSFIENNKVRYDYVSPYGTEDVYYMIIPEDAAEDLKITLAWIDPAASPSDPDPLVNNLDLFLIDPDGNSHYPWTLNHTSATTPVAYRGYDNKNNVEKVEVGVDDLIPGELWMVVIDGADVVTSLQYYALVSNYELIQEDPDTDGDGYYSEDYDGDDCDDSNSNIHPGATEVCDGLDNDCDDSTDEGCGSIEEIVYATQDVFIESDSPEDNFSGSERLFVGVEDDGDDIIYSLIQFDIETLESSYPNDIHSISEATLYLQPEYSRDDCDSTIDLNIAAISSETGEWRENQVTWEDITPINSYPSTESSFSSPEADYDWIAVDVTAMVNDWYEGINGNYGLYIWPEAPNPTSCDPSDLIELYSSETVAPPYLSISLD